MFKWIFLEICFIFLLFSTLNAKVDVSCLSLNWEHIPNKSLNPDSLSTDTCSKSTTFNKVYSKGTWILYFERYIFSKMIQKNSFAFVEDIDSIKFSELKYNFTELEKNFGKIFFFRDSSEHFNSNDTSFLAFPCLDLKFTDFNLVSDQRLILLTISGIDSFAAKYTFNISNIKVDNVEKEFLSVRPNPATDFIEIFAVVGHTEQLQNEIRIYDVFGQIQTTPSTSLPPLQIEGELLRINVSGLAPGVFFIKVGDKVSKFVKI